MSYCLRVIKKTHSASHKCISSYEERWKEIFWLKGFFVCMSPFLMQRQRCRDGWIWREFVGEADRRILAHCVQSRRIVRGCFAALREASDKRNEQPPFCGRTDRGNNKVLYCWDVICWLLNDGPQKHLTVPVSQKNSRHFIYHMSCLIIGHGVLSARFVTVKSSFSFFTILFLTFFFFRGRMSVTLELIRGQLCGQTFY